jgi:Na+/proline symporter
VRAAVPEGDAMNAVLFAIIAYVLIQFTIGAWVSRRIASASDYILAGRQLGVGLVAFSVFATYFGAEAIVASGGAVYENGLSGAVVDPICYAAAIILVGVFFAHALWSRGLTTFADLFRQRYSPGVERVVVIVLVPGSVIWAAAQIRAFGQVLDANSGMGLSTAIVLATVLVGSYSVIGGLLADAVTDLIQGLVLLAGLVVLGVTVAVQVDLSAGGLAHIEPERLRVIDPDEDLLSVFEKMAIPICGTIVAVELISRFLGARTAAIAARGTLVGGLMYIVVGMVPVFLGLVAPGLIPNHPDPEQIVARLAEVYLPGLLHVVFVGAIISAILSVVHSALHAPAAQISHNLITRLLPDLTARQRLWSVRSTVLILSIVAFLISFSSEGIKDLVETASAFGSAGVFVATLFALFTRFGGPLAAHTSIACGMIVWALSKYALGLTAPYLLGLVTALAGYVAGAVIEGRQSRK